MSKQVPLFHEPTQMFRTENMNKVVTEDMKMRTTVQYKSDSEQDIK